QPHRAAADSCIHLSRDENQPRYDDAPRTGRTADPPRRSRTNPAVVFVTLEFRLQPALLLDQQSGCIHRGWLWRFRFPFTTTVKRLRLKPELQLIRGPSLWLEEISDVRRTNLKVLGTTSGIVSGRIAC